MALFKYLGKISDEVPVLTRTEWKSIFNLIEYFLSIDEENLKDPIIFDWGKLEEILALMNKI